METKKVFELALLYNSCDYENADIKTMEFEVGELDKLKQALMDIVSTHDKDLHKVEISIVEKDEDGENISCETLCEINMFVANKFLVSL